MSIKEIIKAIENLAIRTGCSYQEMVEWIAKNNRDEKTLPWEDNKNEKN